MSEYGGDPNFFLSPKRGVLFFDFTVAYALFLPVVDFVCKYCGV